MEIEQIIERHEKFPNATKELIEAYGFQQYRKAITDLLDNCGSYLSIPHSDTVIVVCEKNLFKDWTDAELSNYKMRKK